MSLRLCAFGMMLAACCRLTAAEPSGFEKIQGVWQTASIETDGKIDPGAALDNARFVFEQNLVTIYQAGKRIGEYRFGLDFRTNPATIDFADRAEPKPETSKAGIVRFRGDTLEICLGNTRPKEFRGENGADLMVFQRPKAGKAVAVPAWCLDVSPDGKLLAVAGGRRNATGIVALLNTEDWSVVFSHAEQRAATCVAFSPNGRQLAIGTQLGEVAILDRESQAVLQRWHTGHWAVFGITWTPDNRDVIAACANGFLRRFCADCGTLRTTFDTWQADGTPNTKLGGHADRNLWDAAVTRDGQWLLTGGWNGTTRIWNLTTGGLVRAFDKEESSTQGVKFTPDERHFVGNGLGSKAVIVRNAVDFGIRAELQALGRDVAVHPDGQHIAAATLEDVRVFKLDLSKPTAEQLAEIRKLAEQLAETKEDLREAAETKLKEIGLPADGTLEEASRTAQGDHLERIKTLRTAIRSPEPIATLGELPAEVRQVVYSPTGNFLAASTIAGDVHIWDAKSFKLLHTWKFKTSP